MTDCVCHLISYVYVTPLAPDHWNYNNNRTQQHCTLQKERGLVSSKLQKWSYDWRSAAAILDRLGKLRLTEGSTSLLFHKKHLHCI